MDKKNQQAFIKIWPKIVAKAWADPTFKKKLLTQPHEALKEHEIHIPSDYKIEIHENKKKSIHLTLPINFKDTLSEKDIAHIQSKGICGCGEDI